MANRLRDVEKEAFWRDVVRRHEGSGSNVREFCRREGLAESNFYAWRRTIAQRDARKSGGKRNGKAMAAARSSRKPKAASRSAAKPKKATPTFVPVVATGPRRGTDIVLELGGGRRLRLDVETSARRLAEIVRAIESETGR